MKDYIMSKKEDYEKRTEEYILPILESHGFYLYDLEYVKEAGEYFLRVYIDKEGGITIDDCVTVSREMNEILDHEDYIPDAYTFEVSSPGVNRILKKDDHFTAAIGKEVSAKLFTPIDGQKEFTGILKSFSDKDVTINIEGTDRILQRKDIAKIHLAFTL